MMSSTNLIQELVELAQTAFDFLLRNAIHIEPWVALIALLGTLVVFLAKLVALLHARKH